MNSCITTRAVALTCVLTFALGRDSAAQSIAGRVVDETGQPLRDAAAALWPLEDRGRVAFATRPHADATRTASTDDEGRFFLQAPAPGMWRLEVLAAGRVAMERALVPWVGDVVLPTVALRRDRGLRVAVADPAGSARAGATVIAGAVANTTVWREAVRDGWAPVPRRARTDGRGFARLVHAEGERVRVQAFAADRGSSRTLETENDGTQLQLAAAQNLRVRVTDATGTPVADAEVRLGPGWPAGRTGEDGRLTLVVAAGRRAALEITADDGRRSRTVVEPPFAEHEAIALPLPHRKQIRGTVVARGDGRPIGGALVWSHRDPSAFTSTDAHGRWRLDVDLDEPGFALYAAARGFVGTSRQPDPRAAAAGTELVLRKAVAVRGVVVDTEDRPIDEARIQCLAIPVAEDALPIHAAVHYIASDAAGRFVLQGLEATRDYEVQVAHDGFAARQGIALRPATGSDRDRAVRIVLTHVRTVRGRVVDDQDRPIAGASVALLLAPGRRADTQVLETHERRTETDEDGAFRLRELPGGRFHLLVERAGFASAVVRGLDVVHESHDIDLGVVVLTPGVRLDGLVLGPDDTPMPGARVTARVQTSIATRRDRPTAATRTETTDIEGRFRFVDLVPGTIVDLEARHRTAGRVSSYGIRVPVAKTLALHLRAGHGIMGRTVDTDGLPVVSATIEVRTHDDERLSATSDAEGHFALPNVATGSIRLDIHAPGFGPVSLDPLDVPGDALIVDGLEIVMTPAAVVTGRVTDSDGAPIDSAEIKLVATGEGTAALSAITDEDGRYRLAPSGTGRRWMILARSGFATRRETLDVLSGENDYDWVLAAGVSVAGRLVDHRGQAVVGGVLYLTDAAHPERVLSVRSGEDGTARWQDVAEATYRLHARAAQARTSEPARQITVGGESISGLEIALAPPLAVRGRLLGVSFDELGTVEVSAYHPTAGRISADIDFDGAFSLAGLVPGAWLIGADSGPRRAQRQIAIRADTPAPFVELDLSGSITLMGQVAIDGRPAPDAMVLAYGTENTDQAQTSTGSDGTFRLAGLKRGRYRLVLAEPAVGLRRSEVLRLDGDTVHDFAFATGALSGRIASVEDGQGIGATAVTLHDAEYGGATIARRLAATDGSFRFARVATGVYRVRVEHPDFVPVERLITVDAVAPASGLEIGLAPVER